MKLQIIAVGNKMPAWVVEGTNEYLRRFPADFLVHYTEIAPGKRGKTVDIHKTKQLEGENA